MDPVARLDSVVKGQVKATQDLLALLFVFWGCFNLVGVWLFALVWTTLVFWVLWIPLGVGIQVMLIAFRTRKLGPRLWNSRVIPDLWLTTLLALPLIIWVFPGLLGLYPLGWVFPLTSVWVALAIYGTGVFTQKGSIALGAVVFWVAAPFHVLFPGASPWIFTASAVLGLIVPGLVSLRGRRL
jgi:hypothetical protein